MAAWPDRILSLSALLDRGGVAMWLILAASVLLWTLVIERYWFMQVSFRRRRGDLLARWKARSGRTSRHARRAREGLVAEAHRVLGTTLATIRTLTLVLPLLGLLGTVAGMIETFDVLSVFGTANPRGMADGVSKALLTTMAGLMTSLPALYFSADLRRRAESEVHRLADELEHA